MIISRLTYSLSFQILTYPSKNFLTNSLISIGVKLIVSRPVNPTKCFLPLNFLD